MKKLIITIIRTVIKVVTQQYYKSKLYKKYGITQLPTVDLLDLFPDLNETISNYTFLEGTSLPTDLVLLKQLARRCEKGSYLEIGTWRGESIVNIHDIIRDCTSISYLPTNNYRFKRSEGLFLRNTKNNIKQIHHDSKTFIFESLRKDFDLMFIDGDHSYKSILSDTKNLWRLKKNLKAVIVWHDYGYTTEDVRYSTLKAILDGVPSDYHENLYHVSNTMCAVFMVGITDLNKTFTKYPTFPNKTFEINIKAKRL